MHVLVTGDDDASVDAAAAAVARLLEPLRDEENEHKRAQLRELAVLNGTLREDGGAGGARGGGGSDDVGAAVGAAALPPEIRARVAARYERDVARLTTRGEARGDLSVSDDATYRAFLKEVGVEAAPSSRARDDDAEGAASASAADRRKTYVGRLPPFANEHTVALTFRPFGVIEKVEVVPDRDTNAPCRGFAFVLFAEESAARAAATYFAEVASAFPHPPPPGFAAPTARWTSGSKPTRDLLYKRREGISQTRNVSRKTNRGGTAVSPVRREARADPLERGAEIARRREPSGGRGDGGGRNRRPRHRLRDVVADRVTGLGRGFAFVRMRDARPRRASWRRSTARTWRAARSSSGWRRTNEGQVASGPKARRDARTRAESAGTESAGTLRRSTRTRDRASTRIRTRTTTPVRRRRRGGGGGGEPGARRGGGGGWRRERRIRRSRRGRFTRRRIRGGGAPAPRRPDPPRPRRPRRETSPRRRRRRLLRKCRDEALLEEVASIAVSR